MRRLFVCLTNTLWGCGGWSSRNVTTLVEYKVHYQLGECHDDQTDDGVDQAVLGITDFTTVTTRGDVAEATNDNHDDGNNTDDHREGCNDLLG